MPHTPAPWCIIPATGDEAVSILSVGTPGDEEGTLVADVLFAGDATDDNARLIAAAPELLEAVRRTLALLSAVEATPGPCAAHHAAVTEYARTALSKATGK